MRSKLEEDGLVGLDLPIKDSFNEKQNSTRAGDGFVLAGAACDVCSLTL